MQKQLYSHQIRWHLWLKREEKRQKSYGGPVVKLYEQSKLVKYTQQKYCKDSWIKIQVTMRGFYTHCLELDQVNKKE